MVSAEESARNYQVMVAPMYHIKPTFPMPAAGMYPGLVPVLIEEFGIDGMLASYQALYEELRAGGYSFESRRSNLGHRLS